MLGTQVTICPAEEATFNFLGASPADAARQIRVMMEQGDVMDARNVALYTLRWSQSELERVEVDMHVSRPRAEVRA